LDGNELRLFNKPCILATPLPSITTSKP
jgi:hypothetical protein